MIGADKTFKMEQLDTIMNLSRDLFVIESALVKLNFQNLEMNSFWVRAEQSKMMECLQAKLSLSQIVDKLEDSMSNCS